MPKDTVLDKKITSILEESINEDNTGIKTEVEELAPDVKSVLGIDDEGNDVKSTQKSRNQVTSLAPDLDYLSVDEVSALEEIDSLI